MVPSGFDGSGFYRCLIPAGELRRFGWDVSVAPYAIEQMAPVYGGVRRRMHYGLFERAGGQARIVKDLPSWLLDEPFDVLVMQQREEPGWAGTLAALRAQGKRVLVDSDDAWLHLPAWNPGSRKPAAAIDAMLEQIVAADGLSVATPALAEMYRSYQPNVRVIRNRLDWGMWADIVPKYERPTRKLRVGWMGQSFWRAGDLKVLQGVIGPWLEQHPDVEFVAAGDPRVHDLLGVPKGQRVSVAEVEFDNRDLADITATMDVGLVPLSMDDAKSGLLNECKSHLKGLEYNAAGVPFIASPSESYVWWAKHGGGLIASNPRQWREALDALLDSNLRVDLGMAGREAARECSVQIGGVDEWADWLGGGTYSNPAVAQLAA